MTSQLQFTKIALNDLAYKPVTSLEGFVVRVPVFNVQAHIFDDPSSNPTEVNIQFFIMSGTVWIERK